MFCKDLKFYYVIFGGQTDRQTDRQTDQQTDLGIKAPSRSLKKELGLVYAKLRIVTR